ncbi:hypothetical protein BGZ94_004703 [Podila epigama]|nr:hypothetical protein BGZ94_004703 [Podila epigama]
MPLAIFLDSGDVINDNKSRGPQWIRMVGEFMPSTIVGGPGLFWGRANGRLAAMLFKQGLWYDKLQKWDSHKLLDRYYNLFWIQESARLVNEQILEARERRQQRKNQSQNQDRSQDQNQTKDNDQLERDIEDEYADAPLVVLPESEETCMQIAKMAHIYCLSRAKADFPGAVQAIKALKHEQGFAMYMCSGEQSMDLTLTFRTLGLATVDDTTKRIMAQNREEVKAYMDAFSELIYTKGKGNGSQDDPLEYILGPDPNEPPSRVFTQIYGPDLVDVHKDSTKFYAAIFKHCGVDPRTAVVVDDKEKMLSWAKVLGVRTVLISTVDRTGNEMMIEVPDDSKPDDKNAKMTVPVVDHQLSSLAELPLLTAYWRKHLEVRE